jgi:hypothetical protein
LGIVLRSLGGIAVDRKRNSNMTDFAVSLFEKSETMYLVFTPEGTRKYNPNWKKGFYYIALKANVPIYICYVDFATKTGGFHSLFHLIGTNLSYMNASSYHHFSCFILMNFFDEEKSLIKARLPIASVLNDTVQIQKTAIMAKKREEIEGPKVL